MFSLIILIDIKKQVTLGHLGHLGHLAPGTSTAQAHQLNEPNEASNKEEHGDIPTKAIPRLLDSPWRSMSRLVPYVCPPQVMHRNRPSRLYMLG
jgi:hypothetical protein